MKKGILLLLFCIGYQIVFNQEILLSPNINAALINFVSDRFTLKSFNPDTLTLPFIDDFSKRNVFPDDALWLDNQVYINDGYAINPPTIGVATFDCFNSKGVISDTATSYFISDTLTSKPINLYYPDDTTIYISFYFQSGGNGDPPEIKDSLLIDFFAPDSGKWYRVDAIPGTNNPVAGHEIDEKQDSIRGIFKQRLIHVKDEKFLKKGFQFRFMNRASLSNNQSMQSIISNADIWNIDYVYLNNKRSWKDTIHNDIAFSKQLSSFLLNYTAIPWRHYSPELGNIIMNKKIEINYKNLGDTTQGISRRFAIIDKKGNGDPSYFTGGVANTKPFEEIKYKISFDYTFNSDSKETGEFEVTAYLITDTLSDKLHKSMRWNDTVRYDQKFENFYSYDDGTAEMSYGFTGEGSENAKLAQQYIPYQSDTLGGIFICFTHALYDELIQQNSFKVCVWNNNNGIPGELIYSQQNESTHPSYTNKINGFIYFSFDTAIIISDTFYIGIQQTKAYFIQIGFDANKDRSDKLFYNLDGSWVNSNIKGSLMLRPYFGKIFDYQVPVKQLFINLPEIKIFPNPAKDYIIIQPGNTGNKISIFSTSGIEMYTSQFCSERIDISNLPSGFYFVSITVGHSYCVTKKLIISR